jgi:hypothetical protein
MVCRGFTFQQSSSKVSSCTEVSSLVTNTHGIQQIQPQMEFLKVAMIKIGCKLLLLKNIILNFLSLDLHLNASLNFPFVVAL